MKDFGDSLPTMRDRMLWEDRYAFSGRPAKPSLAPRSSLMGVRDHPAALSDDNECAPQKTHEKIEILLTEDYAKL